MNTHSFFSFLRKNRKLFCYYQIIFGVFINFSLRAAFTAYFLLKIALGGAYKKNFVAKSVILLGETALCRYF